MELIFSWTLRVHWCTGLQPLAGGGAEAAICDKPLWKHGRRWVYRVLKGKMLRVCPASDLLYTSCSSFWIISSLHTKRGMGFGSCYHSQVLYLNSDLNWIPFSQFCCIPPVPYFFVLRWLQEGKIAHQDHLLGYSISWSTKHAWRNLTILWRVH
jgi:hypothetical protein